ncbi:MAG: glycosyltransferase family 4 protein [Thermotogae bacterium]|nr:glycosyltransferase family 4 protein [Thermotogota bacterium]
MKVAYVHDWLITRAGAERVLEAMVETVEAHRIFTLFYEKRNFKDSVIDRIPVEESFLSKFPFAKRYYRLLLPFMPMAVESFDLSGYDLIISSSHAVAKGIIPHPDQIHVSYVHTPMRYAWDLNWQYLQTLGSVRRFLVQFILNYIRVWDLATAARVDVFLANSKTVASRIKRYYGREAEVIYPPVDVERFHLSEKVDNYFIVVSRLVPYKRVDVIVEAFNGLPWKLLVVGDGPEFRKLKRIAKGNVEFLGRVRDEEVVELLSKARAFVFAAHEDFGISPVEAMASGVPVIAYGKGGVRESVEEGISGLFFYSQTPQAVREAVEEFVRREDAFDRSRIRKGAMRFSRANFKEAFKRVIERTMSNPPLSV